MIECIFTLDYEIYGNGTGSLRQLVYEPATRLMTIFCKWNVPFVAFVEAAELRQIERHGTDEAIDDVVRQVRRLHREGVEIALHLHPQWCGAVFEGGRWKLSMHEYNLCTLSQARIREIVGSSVEYLNHLVDDTTFRPRAFRAGNWLFQPTTAAAQVLLENGITTDSSVFKGGLQRNHGLDYRGTWNNGFFWSFSTDVRKPDTGGEFLEIPIHTKMVPVWRLATAKRFSAGGGMGTATGGPLAKINRLLDFCRPLYPRKLDFCRMSLHELTTTVAELIVEDQVSPDVYRPIVAIGHTKDPFDAGEIDGFLRFLRERAIDVVTLEQAGARIRKQAFAGIPVSREMPC